MTAASRHIAPVDNKLKTDTIWMIWEILLLEASNRGALIKKIINAMLEVFCIKYKSGSKRKRRFLLYNVISLLTERVDHTIPIFNEEGKIETIKNKKELIFRNMQLTHHLTMKESIHH